MPSGDERRVVTVLAADVAGSTRLGESLDPEQVKLLVGEALRLAIAEVERFGGTVKDLAGDGVLALFGAPVTHEDDGERALLAALGIVTTMRGYADEVRRSYGVEGFSMRVGVATGEAVLGEVGGGGRVEYGAVGDVVNTAARLQAAAGQGEVMVAASTRRLVEGAFSWGPERDLDLKGKAEPVRASTVEAAVAGRHADGLAAPLVGRDAELAALEEVLGGLAQGRGGVVFVVGEAGLGKSRLLGEAHARAGAAVDWLDARAASYAEATPYWLYRDLLREWLGVAASDPQLRVRIELRRRLDDLFGSEAGEVWPYLAALLEVPPEPADRARLEALSPESLQFRTFEVVGSLVEAAAERKPLVLAFDDMHWADPTSVQLTERLLPICERAPVALVVGMRPERDHASWGLRRACEEEFPHLFKELRLGPLAPDQERRLLDALRGDARLGGDVEQALLGYSEGNPFYLEEMLRSALDRDGAFALPETVGAAILARVDRLDEATKDTVRAASVLGRTFRLGLVAAVTERAADDLRPALHALQRLDLIREERRWPEPEFRFKHALIQEAVYESLVRPDRQAAHRRAAEWLEKNEGSDALLARHWKEAADAAQAIRYLQLAGDRARDEWALDEAVEHYRDLVPLLRAEGRAGDAAETLFKLGLALHTAMRYVEANAVWQEAFEAWQPPAPDLAPASVLRIASPMLPAAPDVFGSTAWTNIQLAMQVYDRLVEAWPGRNVVPSLADRWEVSPDGLRYEFRLREGLSWHDGTPLRAADIADSIKRELDPSGPAAGATIYFVIKGATDYFSGRAGPEAVGIRPLDERRLEIELANPAPYFMSVMNRPDGNAHMLPGSPVGTGAFELEAATPERVVLRRSERAVRRAGAAARVEMLRMTAAEAAQAYARDELDMILMRVTGATPELPADHPDAIATALTAALYLAPNFSAACASAELRRALALSVDRVALAAVLAPPSRVATGGLVPPALQGHTPEIALGFDPSESQRLLAASGFSGELCLSASPMWDRVAHAVAGAWREHLGIEVEVVSRPQSSARMPDEVDIEVTNWLPGYPDPEYYLRLLLHSRSLTNAGGWHDARFDDLIERAVVERESGARLALFHEADRLAVAEECAVIPLAYLGALAFVKPHVQGWWEWGKSSASFADLRISR